LNTYASSFFPDNLALNSGGNLVYSSVDPASYSDPQALATNGPTVQLGNASGLGFLASVKTNPGGQTMALQSFSYHNGNFDLAQSGLENVNLSTGATTPVTLSRPLVEPSALAFGQGGFGPGNTLVTEVGDGTGNPTLDSISPSGTVSVINSNLTAAGATNPVDMQFTPATGWGPANDLMILNVGSTTSNVITNNSGSIIRVDNTNPSNTSPFLAGLKNPVAMEFGNGSLLGNPSQEYLYVLEAGDVNSTSGILQGTGELVAYDSLGNPTVLADNILDPTSMVFSANDSTLYFNSENGVFALQVPEPASLGLIAVAGPLLLRRRQRTR
jgi:hypothetical protein